MKIIKKKDALHVTKPEGIDVSYYLFNEYEVHYNEQSPQSSQIWHHHEKVWESIFIIEGELLAKWKEAGEERSERLSAGDLIETERTPHTFVNESDKLVKFLVIKQLPHGKDFRQVLKEDKVLDN